MGLIKQLGLVGALCGLAYLGYVYGWPLVRSADSGQAVDAPSPEQPAIDVIVEAASLQPERVRIETIGTAEAIRSATLYPATSGEVVAMSMAPNRKVAKGDTLLELDARSARLAVELAQVRVQDARRQVERFERTANSGAVSKATIDAARTALDEAEIALRQAEVDLADRRVRAPFTGIVGMTAVEVGDRIDEDDEITTLDDRSALLIDFEIPEVFLERFARGQPVSVSTWAERARVIEGSVVELGSRIDPISRSFTARARVPNGDDRLRPGMSFAVTIDLYGALYPLVPEVAVQWSGDGAYLWVVRGGRAARVPVRIVQRQAGMALVDAAVEAGEPIVVEGIQRMRDGLEVGIAEPGGA